MFELWKVVRRTSYLLKRFFEKLYDKVDNKEHVFAFLDKILSDIVSKYDGDCSIQSNHQLVAENNHGIIWTAWLQGEHSAPDCVKRCIASMRRNCNNHEVVVLTEDNWTEYVTLPEVIVEKYRSGKMLPAHFADILRLACLRTWGGLWLDSTVYVSSKIPESYFKHPFFTIRRFEGKIKLTNGQWTTWCIGGLRNNILISFLFDAHVSYWMKCDKAFDYFLFDYFIAYARDKIQKLREELEVVEYNNVNALALADHLNDQYEPNRLTEILDSGVLFKLSYKIKIRNDIDVNYYHL